MAYFKLNAYDADVWISSFGGLQQYGPGMDIDPRYAVEEKNVETPAGVLQPMAAPTILNKPFTGLETTPRIETLMHLHRRWYSGQDDKDVLFAALGGKIYYLTSSSTAWTPITMPDGVTSFESDVWSWVNYEVNPEEETTEETTEEVTEEESEEEPEEESEEETEAPDPIDVLIISNAVDGMFMIKGSDFSMTLIEPKASETGDVMKFGVIERYAERIWGGAMPDDPDMLAYSRPFDPEDWTGATEDEQPEDGGGTIQQPSWDGDSFTALKQFGQQLIAFKQHRVWRILGTDPGEYTFKEQYGGGTPYVNTVAVDIERILMVEKDGLSSYDGLSVTPLQRTAIEDLWKTVNKSALDQMCAVLFKQKYYLAFPTGNSQVNNALLILNLQDGTILYNDGVSIESFLVTEDKLYATSSTLPGKVLVINWDSWTTGEACGAATRWVTPWMTLNREDMKKGGFDLYFQPEVQDEAVTFQFTVQTEKKAKTKAYTVLPLSEASISAGKEYKQKRLHFGGSGRRFRVIIETANNVTAPWRLIGGIMMIVETDPD